MDKVEKLYTKDDMNNFVFTAIHNDEGYTKEYTVGDLKITMKTRSMIDTEQLTKYSDAHKAQDNVVSNIHYMCVALLASTLVKVNDTVYNIGTLEEKIKVIQNMTAPKFKLLVDTMDIFNKMVDQMLTDFDRFYKAP